MSRLLIDPVKRKAELKAEREALEREQEEKQRGKTNISAKGQGHVGVRIRLRVRARLGSAPSPPLISYHHLFTNIYTLLTIAMYLILNV